MRKVLKDTIRNLFFITIGAAIAAVGLECFLVPNKIIDGGIIGISIMGAYIFKQFSLGAIIFCLNIPFIFLALQKFGKKFVFNTFYGISWLSIFVSLCHNHKITDDLILAAVFGGVVLGLGVGLILRNNGALDGTEIVAIRLAPKLGFSIGEIIMTFNVFIFFSAGFLFGFDRAMYSILTYFIAYKVIDIVLEGLNESKSVRIVTDFSKEIGDKMIKEMGASVTYIDAEGGYSGKPKRIIYCVISRLEVTKLKQLVKDVDSSAFISIENVHEVEGKRIKKR
ncbi:YitT family protein [bacterium]|nr:YitT family protein [bacterium]